jgi:hypothetical protein
VARSTIVKHLEEKRYSLELMGGRSIAALLTAAAPLVASDHESDLKDRSRRLGYCSAMTRILRDADVGRAREVHANCSRLSFAAITAGGPKSLLGSQAAPSSSQASASLAKVGDYSLTILRHPFARALSANMYKVRRRPLQRHGR